jgi:hypothetical protein
MTGREALLRIKLHNFPSPMAFPLCDARLHPISLVKPFPHQTPAVSFKMRNRPHKLQRQNVSNWKAVPVIDVVHRLPTTEDEM